MKNFPSLGHNLPHFSSSSRPKIAFLQNPSSFLIVCLYRSMGIWVNPFLLHLSYFIFVSVIGFWILIGLKTRTEPAFVPGKLNLFFTSVSATTLSSMATVEMEVFSNAQLVVLTFLMFLGGEIFASMVGLQLRRFNLRKLIKKEAKVSYSIKKGNDHHHDLPSSNPTIFLDGHNNQIGLVATTSHDFENPVSNTDALDDKYLKYDSIKFLGVVICFYLVICHVLGVTLVTIYITLVASARDLLNKKSLNLFTFSIFTVVSTFANCGFVPTNENMVVFSQNSFLLLILVPQMLLGNTLYPSFLRFSIWFMGKFIKSDELNYVLKRSEEIQYYHLLPSLHATLLVVTVFAFIFIQFVLFALLQWNSEALTGLDSYQKVVGIFFQSVNSRHSGETIVDLSIISPAMLVLFIVMMYLPPYTSFLPVQKGHKNIEKGTKGRGKTTKNLILSQLSYLSIFIVIVCITEKKKMKEDPINFSGLNIVHEVISAYGNVGFTTGYSCKRQLHPDVNCKDKYVGFVGKWSDEGKIVLIIVMFFGRLKKLNMDGGKSWKLL